MIRVSNKWEHLIKYPWTTWNKLPEKPLQETNQSLDFEPPKTPTFTEVWQSIELNPIYMSVRASESPSPKTSP